MPGLFRRRKRTRYYGPFPLAVNPVEPLENLIEQGRFRRVKGDIAGAGFPDARKEPYAVDIELLELCESLYSILGLPGALSKLEARGYRGATAREFIEFAAQHPEAQYGWSSVSALGAVQERGGEVHALTIWDRGNFPRTLDLHRISGPGYGSYWMGGHVFAAVKLGTEQAL